MSDAVFFPGLVPTGFGSVARFVTESPHARRRFAEADEILGYSLADAYRDASIHDWEVFQSAFMALTLALADWAEQQEGMRPALCCGQSFGGIVGAVYCGALSYADALSLTRESATVERDYFDSLAEPVGCYFFTNVPRPDVERLVEEFQAAGDWIEISVEMDSDIFAVSARMETIERFKARTQELGAFAFYTMNRAEHCSGVAALRERLYDEVYSRFTWRAPRIPMLSDVDGTLIDDGERLMHDLLDGWVYPVRWRTMVDGLREAGVSQVYVVGPRTMFSRVTREFFPTRPVTPKLALAAVRAATVGGGESSG